MALVSDPERPGLIGSDRTKSIVSRLITVSDSEDVLTNIRDSMIDLQREQVLTNLHLASISDAEFDGLDIDDEEIK